MEMNRNCTEITGKKLKTLHCILEHFIKLKWYILASFQDIYNTIKYYIFVH